MDVEQIKNQAVKFNRARNNLLLVVVLTMVNLVLITLDMDLNFLFSAILPQIILLLFMDISIAFAMMAAVIVLSFYLICFFLSKKWRVFILIAFLVFAIDTLALFATIIIFYLNFSDFIFDAAFHVWIHFYLITGVIAWIKLMGVSKDDFRAVIAEAKLEAEKEELDSAIDTIAPDDGSNESDKK